MGSAYSNFKYVCKSNITIRQVKAENLEKRISGLGLDEFERPGEHSITKRLLVFHDPWKWERRKDDEFQAQ